MNDDEKIDLILKSVKNGEEFNAYSVLSSELGESHNDFMHEHDLLIEKMSVNNLITMPYSRSENTYRITSHGADIVKGGGWLKHILNGMTKEKKIHELLKFTIENKSHGWQWTLDDLMPAFKYRINRHEIEYLCRELIKNEHASTLENHDYFAIGITRASEAAYYGNVYLSALPPSHQATTSIHINDLQSIVGSTIHGDIIKSAGPIKIDKSIVEPKSPSYFKEIIIGVVILVVSALILFYIFGIN